MNVLMVTGAYSPEISSGGLQSQIMAGALRGRAEVRVLTTALDPTTPRHSNGLRTRATIAGKNG